MGALIAKVFKQGLWMALHDAPSCKRTILFSTMSTIASLDLGPLTKAEKEKRVTLRTVRDLSLDRSNMYPSQSGNSLNPL